MGTEIRADSDPNLTTYEEGKAEVKFTDRLLEGWTWYARNTGLPRLGTHCPLGAMVKGDPTECATTARVLALDLNDSQFMAIDQAVGRLPRALQRVVFVEYWQAGSARQKARRMRPSISHLEYRQRLNAAQWAVYAALLPDVERWRGLWKA